MHCPPRESTLISIRSHFSLAISVIISSYNRRRVRSSSSSSLLIRPTRLIPVGDRAFPAAGSRLRNGLLHVVTSAPVPSLLGRCKQKQRGLRGYYVAGPPLLNGRCTSLLRVVVSEMTYTVSSGTLNSTIPYHTIPYISSGSRCFPESTQNLPVLSFVHALTGDYTPFSGLAVFTYAIINNINVLQAVHVATQYASAPLLSPWAPKCLTPPSRADAT